MDERKLNIDAWTNRDLYAFVERNDPVDESESEVVLDAIRADDAEDVLRSSPEDQEALSRLPGVLIAGRFRNEAGAPDLAEGSWQGVRLGTSGVDVGVFAELNSAPVTSRLVATPLSKPVVKKLDKAFDLTPLFSEATPEALDDLLGWPEADMVAVYRVGQGSCSALCDSDERPLLYYDVGGGCLWNTKTYPVPLRFCTTQSPTVLLSHWAFDHWFSAFVAPRLATLPWLVPNQGTVGKRTLAFARTLTNARFWPANTLSHAFPGGTVVRCNGASRNDSGLALFASVGADRTVLLPADAQFSFVTPPAGVGPLVGLVATHHGSNHVGSGIPRPAADAKLVYSYGVANTYNHPTVAARSLYDAEGWKPKMVRETPAGHVWLGNPGAGMPCGGGSCDLKTTQ